MNDPISDTLFTCSVVLLILWSVTLLVCSWRIKRLANKLAREERDLRRARRLASLSNGQVIRERK